MRVYRYSEQHLYSVEFLPVNSINLNINLFIRQLFVMLTSVNNWTCFFKTDFVHVSMLQVVGEWRFSKIHCDIFVTLDVMMCTASILNLCAISIDRYVLLSVREKCNDSLKWQEYHRSIAYLPVGSGMGGCCMKLTSWILLMYIGLLVSRCCLNSSIESAV